MESHQERMLEEHTDLLEKIGKLSDFMEGEVFESLSHDEQLRLRRQRGHMHDYSVVLHERIKAWELS